VGHPCPTKNSFSNSDPLSAIFADITGKRKLVDTQFATNAEYRRIGWSTYVEGGK
jgi:hypothetical protein